MGHHGTSNKLRYMARSILIILSEVSGLVLLAQDFEPSQDRNQRLAKTKKLRQQHGAEPHLLLSDLSACTLCKHNLTQSNHIKTVQSSFLTRLRSPRYQAARPCQTLPDPGACWCWSPCATAWWHLMTGRRVSNDPSGVSGIECPSKSQSLRVSEMTPNSLIYLDVIE